MCNVLCATPLSSTSGTLTFSRVSSCLDLDSLFDRFHSTMKSVSLSSYQMSVWQFSQCRPNSCSKATVVTSSSQLGPGSHWVYLWHKPRPFWLTSSWRPCSTLIAIAEDKHFKRHCFRSRDKLWTHAISPWFQYFVRIPTGVTQLHLIPTVLKGYRKILSNLKFVLSILMSPEGHSGKGANLLCTHTLEHPLSASTMHCLSWCLLRSALAAIKLPVTTTIAFWVDPIDCKTASSMNKECPTGGQFNSSEIGKKEKGSLP